MKLDSKQRMQLSAGLEALATGLPSQPDAGICRNLNRAFGDGSVIGKEFQRAVTQGICSGWEHFSGRDVYPVPAPVPEEFRDPASRPFWDGSLAADEHYWVTLNHWEGEYGDRRRELALWLSEVVLTWENDEDEDENDEDDEYS